MDLRGYSVALIPVIAGLGLTSRLGSFNRLVRRRREICWDALPLAWALIALLRINKLLVGHLSRRDRRNGTFQCRHFSARPGFSDRFVSDLCCRPA